MAGNGFDHIARAYTWNDSVLLLAYVNNHHQHWHECALRDFSRLKGRIDEVAESYGVVVKGRAFPLAARSKWVAE